MSETTKMKRLPVIRHIRYLYLRWRFTQWWIAVGQHLGAYPNERDLDYLEDVWNGRA